MLPGDSTFFPFRRAASPFRPQAGVPASPERSCVTSPGSRPDGLPAAEFSAAVEFIIWLAGYCQWKLRFPAAKKTVTRFRDGGYCGCNLFAFMTPASHRVAAAWRRVEQQRKNPLRIISQLGWWSVLRYLLGWMTLDGALGELSQRLKVAIAPVHLPYPEAAIDVDSIADQKLVEGIAGNDK